MIELEMDQKYTLRRIIKGDGQKRVEKVMIGGGKGFEMTHKNFTPDVRIVQIKKMDWMNRIGNLS